MKYKINTIISLPVLQGVVINKPISAYVIGVDNTLFRTKRMVVLVKYENLLERGFVPLDVKKEVKDFLIMNCSDICCDYAELINKEKLCPIIVTF